MELDAILAEARSRYSQSAPVSDATMVYDRAGVSNDSYRAPAEPDDSFVVIDENGSYSGYDAPYSEPAARKRSRKPLIITLIVVLVLLIAAGGGVTWYMMSGSENFAQNVTVSGVSLAEMDMNEAKTALAPVEQKLADKISIEVLVGQEKFTLTKDDFKYSFDTDKVLNEAKDYSAQKGIKNGVKSYEITMTVDDSTCAGIAERIAKQVDTEPVSAKVVSFNSEKSDMFTYSNEVEGKSLKKDELAKSLSALVTSGKVTGTVEGECDSVVPEYTVEYLKSHIVKISSFTTTSTNNSNGNENMRISLASCNNSIIEPGETWSFNSCTGNSNLESNGYKPAGVLVEGRHEIGIGGGICQSSTTIYNAGILSGMDIVERYCHYYRSAYVDPGRDATIDYGNLDLKLRNPYQTQLFLKCYMDGVVLHAEIYGIQPEEFDEVKVTTSSPSYFSNGYKVSATRTYYLNGNKVRSEDLPSSTYYTSAPGGSSSSATENNSQSRATPDEA